MKSRDLKNELVTFSDELVTFTQMLEFNKKSRNIVPWKKELNKLTQQLEQLIKNLLKSNEKQGS